MHEADPPAEQGESKFQRTLVRVIVVQVVALALLAFLQLRY